MNDFFGGCFVFWQKLGPLYPDMNETSDERESAKLGPCTCSLITSSFTP